MPILHAIHGVMNLQGVFRAKVSHLAMVGVD